jgi:predicted Fe-S protein YdhL (DUF1289 family)
MINKQCKLCKLDNTPSNSHGCDRSNEKGCNWYISSKEFNKHHVDELNSGEKERIKNNIEDGENFIGI